MREMAHVGDLITEALDQRVDPASPQRVRQVAQWMHSVRLEPMDDARMGVLCFCESGAELQFLYEFAKGPAVLVSAPDSLTNGRLTVRCQVTAAMYRMDFLVSSGKVVLGVEIDGLGYHRQSPEQVQDDYTRQRQLLLAGYPIARFTAAEVFRDSAGCWQQLRWILEAWARG